MKSIMEVFKLVENDFSNIDKEDVHDFLAGLLYAAENLEDVGSGEELFDVAIEKIYKQDIENKLKIIPKEIQVVLDMIQSKKYPSYDEMDKLAKDVRRVFGMQEPVMPKDV